MRNFPRVLCLFSMIVLIAIAGCSRHDTTGPFVSSSPSSQPSEERTPLVPSPSEISPTTSPTVVPTLEPTESPTKQPIPTPTDKKLLALTFDDGPDSDTSGLLDVLDKYQVKATFFVLGEWLGIESNQKILRRIADSGHEIGNHSYNHPNMQTLSDEDFLAQISRTNTLVKEITGQTPVLFRPPGGRYTEHQLAISNMTFVLWNVDTWDWYRIGTTPVREYTAVHNCTEAEAVDILSDEILYEHGTGYENAPAAPLLERLAHGDILLLHDIHPGTAVLVDKLLAELTKSEEYMFVTVSDLIAAGGTAPQVGQCYRSMHSKK